MPPTCAVEADRRKALLPRKGIGVIRETQSIAFLRVPGSE
jgi:hypothetical protein